MVISCFQPISKISTFFPPSTHLGSSPFLQNPQACPNFRKLGPFPKHYRPIEHYRRSGGSSFVSRALLPVDPWAPTIDSQSIASQLFAVSLFPYLGFLYFITKSGSAPKLTLFGFYFLLAFVGATIPAGIYAKVHYGTSLANVDWLHGGAEFLLTLTNLFIVLGLRDGLRKAKDKEKSSSKAD